MSETQKCNRCKHILPMTDYKIKPKGDYCKQCLVCSEYIRNYRANNKCPHGKQKEQCRDCKGSSFCVHNKQKTQCKECNIYGHLKRVVISRMNHAFKRRDLKANIEYLNVDIEMYYEILSYLNRDTDFTWDNYGELWNIDHIKPLGEKDITDEELIKRLSWCNTRPLLKTENRKKSNKPFIEEVDNSDESL